MRSIFGKLTPYNSIIHRLDPRLKFFALIALMVLCFLPYGNYANRFIILNSGGLYPKVPAPGIPAPFILLITSPSSFSNTRFIEPKSRRVIKSLLVMMVFLMIIFVFLGQNVDPSSLHPFIVFPNGYTIYYEGILEHDSVDVHGSRRMARMVSRRV